VTVPLSAGSSRGVAAAKFGAELRHAMLIRKLGQLRLAEAVGCAKSAIPNWKGGNNLPRVETAAKLAEVLEWPRLIEIARSGRVLTCARCKRRVVNEGGAPARFCGIACRNVDEQLRRPAAGSELAAVVRAELARKVGMKGGIPRAPLTAALDGWTKRESRRVQRLDRLAEQVSGLHSVVDEMCAWCEPMGVCRTAECPLRPASRLPLQGNAVGEVRPVEGAWGPTNRPTMLAAIRAANAARWSRPGERERASARSRDRFAAMSPEERAEHGRRISIGRRRAS